MKRKLRLAYAALFLFLLIVEILIALFVRDAFIRPYFGDVLVTVLLCAFCRILIPKGVRLLPVYVFLFAAAVEVSQHFNLVGLLGLGEIPFFSVLMGTAFSWFDLICYAVGCIAFAAMEPVITKIFQK